jgi:hypothetical protein
MGFWTQKTFQMAKAKKKSVAKKTAKKATKKKTAEEALQKASAVWLTDNQLSYIIGAGSLVCVPRGWLKKLGFDPDQESCPVDIAVTFRGQREIWDTEQQSSELYEESERAEAKEFFGHE